MKQLSVQWISYRSGVGAEVQVMGGFGGGGGCQVCLIAEQRGMEGCRGGGRPSEFPDTAAGGQTVT